MNIIVIGLTGMSGAGKSTVRNSFEESGYYAIDCDKLAREVVRRGKPCLAEIAENFPPEVIAPDKTLDRKKMAEIVFSDGRMLSRLNGIIYPYISYVVIDLLLKAEKSGYRFALLDAPTLYESGIDSICNGVVAVVAEKECCKKRIMVRDGITEEMAEKRLSSQHDKAYFRAKSQYIIENDGTPEQLSKLTIDIIKRIGTEYDESRGREKA